MRAYIARRLLWSIPTIVGMSLLIFLIMRILPGDVAHMLLGGEGASATPREYQALREKLGLDRPLYEQYADWVGKAARLDFGLSLLDERPVIWHIRYALPITANLAVYTILLTVIMAVPIGVMSALHQDRPLDYLLRSFSIVGLSIPNFWFGIMVLLFLVILFRWMPDFEYVSPFTDPWGNLKQMIWPSMTLALAHLAVVARMMRSCLLEVLREDYIRTARAKGLTEGAVVSQHALKNAIIPVVTVAGIQFAVMLGGTVVTETVFNLPGLGRLLVRGVEFRDYPMAEGIIVLFGTFVVLTNLGVDLLYGWLDPRIRYQ